MDFGLIPVVDFEVSHNEFHLMSVWLSSIYLGLGAGTCSIR
jgi:hypothetical protein